MVVRSLSHVPLFAASWAAAHQAPLASTVSQSWLLLSRSVVSDPLRPHGPQHARLPCPPPSPRAAQTPVLDSERLFILGAEGIGVSATHSLSKEYSGLISFRIDGFEYLAVQETLKSLLQHHNLKVSTLQCSAILMV